MGPAMVGFAYLILHDRYTHSGPYRRFVWSMVIFVVISTGLVGLAAAVWRYIIIQLGERRNRLPS
jgi:hypothetical protein